MINIEYVSVLCILDKTICSLCSQKFNVYIYVCTEREERGEYLDIYIIYIHDRERDDRLMQE